MWDFANNEFPSFRCSRELYRKCFDSYSYFGGKTGNMHMPVRFEGDDDRERCLDNLNEVICGLLIEEERIKRVCDLGCGRGSLGVQIAARMNAAVYGIASIEDEIVEASDRAKNATVELLCNFSVEDMNCVGSRYGGQFDAVTTVETDFYFKSYEFGLEQISEILTQRGIWVCVRIFITEGGGASSVGKQLSSFIARGWKTLPLSSVATFRDLVRGKFVVEKEIDLTERVVDYWRSLGPFSLSSAFLIKARFAYKSWMEARSMSDFWAVYKHRIAFYYSILGMERGFFSFRVYKLRKI